MNDKQYAERDIEALDEDGNYYVIHIDAMTRENLVGKSEIAAELAWHDQNINKLKSALEWLVKLKKSKDANGKTDEYREDKPHAWLNAIRVLKELQP